jgi:hypothetical protein
MDRIRLHNLEIKVIKVIPMLLALTALLNTLLSYFYMEVPLLSYIGGVSILPLLFLYLSSYAFGFCSYHRMFLHYVSLNWVLNIYDYYIGIPLSDKELLLMYLIITGIFLFIILYLHQKSLKDR